MMKKTLFVALLGLMTIANAMANVDFETLTITLKNNQVVTYHASELDSVRYVGGDFGTGIGVKIYLKNNTQSVDYLYSQITSFVKSQQEVVETPVITPNGGTIYAGETKTVRITCATEDAIIYYTTDNTAPSASSAPYTGPIIVSQSITIKAIAIKGEVSSEIATAIFTYSSGTDNNLNANWHETAYNIPESGETAKSSSATYNQAWRIEYPHINTSSNSMVVVHATSEYEISLSMELDKSQRANRWSCFTMHAGVPNNDVGRGSFKKDPLVPAASQVEDSEYTTGKYTTSCRNLDGSNTTLFARGHICASEDRQSLKEQNNHTFYTSNCHPQYQAHNGGLWGRLETIVQSWGYNNNFRDTLYVCKGATIANVNLDGSTVSGTIPYSEVQSLFGVTLTGTLTIPRYWYMAVLCLKDGTYHAMAFWSEQINSSCSNTTLRSCMITIDELERRTGIDFFCNLPDDIEDAVEATVETSFWNVTN